jgi:hypothetical protein
VCLRTEEDIDSAPSDVFRFVATEHFADPPGWDPSVIQMTQTSPGPCTGGRPPDSSEAGAAGGPRGS